MNDIDAGAGYRLLTDGEIIQTGDEFFAGGGEWVARDATVGDRMHPGLEPTRRKVAVDPGAGYRLLTVGETIQAGDEYLAAGDNCWGARGCSVGSTMENYYLPTRRKVAAPIQPNAGAGYRLLQRCEPILLGDEFLCGEKWLSGVDLGKNRYDAIRRAVDPGAGYRILAVGEIVDRSDEVFVNGRWETTCFSCGPVVGGTFRRRQQPDALLVERLVTLLERAVATIESCDGGFSYRLFRKEWAASEGEIATARRIAKQVRKNCLPVPPTPDIRML